jgi:type IV pilus assembly protein PilB
LNKPDQNRIQDAILTSLINTGVIAEDEARLVVVKAKKEKQSISTYLVDNALASEKQIAASCAANYALPLLNCDALNEKFLPADLIDEAFIHKNQVAPLFRRGGTLFVGISNPATLHILNEAEFQSQLTIQAVIVERGKLLDLIKSGFSSINAAVDSMDIDSLDKLAFSSDGKDQEDTSDIPVVRFISKILLDAIDSGASDIHFEPYTEDYRIRYRQDGILRKVFSPPLAIGNRLASRLKVMARLNIAEKRIPQDGQITLRLSKHRTIGFRVSTCPILHGEKIVLRLLNTSGANLSIGSLGMDAKQLADYHAAIAKPYGLILVTGPTGSGKTVTQYSALNQLNTPDRNIVTIEDPVEIPMDGVNQVNIKVKAGLTFASALRSFLRQDPDIIMVGEIRDLETAEISIKAAQTGHLVFSTLHTNDAPQTLTRLLNIGVAPYNIASSILLIMAQRLVRTLCTCKQSDEIPEKTLREEGFSDEEIAGGLTIYHPVGCSRCTNGYRGRIGIFQVMPLCDEMERLILEGGTTVDLQQLAAKEGIASMRRSGLNKVRDGITSLEELNRVTID